MLRKIGKKYHWIYIKFIKYEESKVWTIDKTRQAIKKECSLLKKVKKM